MRPVLLVTLVAALALAPAPLRAQDVDLLGRVDPATLAVVRPILEEARRDSVPLRVLESKVLEGVAKNASPEQIGRVVSELAGELATTRSRLRAAVPAQPLTDGEVVAVTLVQRQGIGVEVVRSLWESRADDRSLEVPVTVLGELVRRGVPVAEAADLMRHVVRTSVPLPVAAQIPGKFDGAAGAGAPPGQALAEALRVLKIPDPPGRGRGRGG